MQCRCRPLLSHVHALGLLRMLTTRLPADGIGFRRPSLFSGCRLRCASPVRFALWRRHLATWPAPRRASFAPDRSPKQSALTSRSTTTNPSSPVRHTRRSPRETKSRRSTHAAPKQPDASLEVSFPFSAFQPRCAVRGGQAPDNPASAFALRRATRASATFALRRRPCGFSLCGCDAALLDVRTWVACGFAIVARRVARRLNNCAQDQLVYGRLCRRRSGKPIGRAHVRPVTSSATASL